METDAARTKNAIGSIRSAFGSVFDNCFGSATADINEGMMQMAQRLAKQIAAGHVKRIMHGALNCSNVSIDGGWVDYGTISTISDYGRIIVAKGNPDLWLQSVPVKKSLHELNFYLKKYLPQACAAGIRPAADFIGIFDSAHREALAFEYIKLIGATPDLAARVDFRRSAGIFACFTEITARGNAEPFKLSLNHVAEMPEKMGTYKLSEVIQAASVCRGPAEMNQALESKLSDARLRQWFCDEFYQIRESIVSSCEVEARPFVRLTMLFNAIRLNVPFEDLYRPILDRSIRSLIASSGDIGVFISSKLSRARTLLADSTDHEMDLGGIMSVKGRRGACLVRFEKDRIDAGYVLQILGDMDDSIIPGPLAHKLRAYASELFSSVR